MACLIEYCVESKLSSSSSWPCGPLPYDLIWQFCLLLTRIDCAYKIESILVLEA